MNELQILNINGIECYEEGGTAYLKLETVARGLGFTKTDRKNGVDYTRVHKQNLQKWLFDFGLIKSEKDELPEYIPEQVFYLLSMKAENENGRAFQHTVAYEVIPSIRKHGAYMTPETLEAAILNPDTMIKLCTALKEEQDKRKALETENETMKPKALFADSVTASKNSILVGEMAKLLKQNGVHTGQNRLFETLREKGYLIRRQGNDYNMPTQKSMELGLFEIKETVINHSDGHTSVNKTPKITGKGQQYFVNLFLGG